MVTHDPEEAMLMADRIVLMRNGRVVQTGSPRELYNEPVDAFAAEFFGDVNHLEGVVDGEWITTEAGQIPNKNYPDGAAIDVLVRPDAISLGSEELENSLSKQVHVCAVDYVGGSSHVRLGFSEEIDDAEHITARHPGPFDAAIGDRLQLNIDQTKTFTFPKLEDV